MIRSLLLVLMSAVSLPLAAQTFPNKPVRIIVGYAAGGGNDIIVRVMTPALQQGLGQAVVVENKPGAQSIIAAELVAKAPADGYTLLMGPSGPMTMNPATYAKLPYSPTKDFAPISMICQFPLFVAIDPKLPVQSVKELVDYAKRNPGKVNYAASAAPFQIAAELFKQRTGTDFAYIPYKSSGDSVKALMTSEVTMTITDPPPAVGPMKGGQIRVLAITSPKVRERFATMGLDPVGGSPEDLGRTVVRDIERWTGVARAANIKSQ